LCPAPWEHNREEISLTVDQTEDVEKPAAAAAAIVDAEPAPDAQGDVMTADAVAVEAAADAAPADAAASDPPAEDAAAAEAVDAAEAVAPDLESEAAVPESAAPESVATETAAESTAPETAAESAPLEAAPESVAETAPEAAISDEAESSVDLELDAETRAEVELAPAADPEAEEEPVAALAAPAPAADPRPEPTTMEELLAEQSTEIRSLKHGDVVEGTVVRIDKDEILVDIGAKSEGVVSNRELYGRNAESQPQLNIGDTVLVYVLQPESNEGHAVLSLRRAGLERKWRAMQEQLDAGVIIEAPVIDHNKGGLIVDCGIRGFVPISQIVDFPRRPQNEQPRDAAQEIAEKLQPYVGRKLRLKILEVNRKANRLILSEKVALYEERREKRDELFSSLKVGQQVKGTVRSIAPFGVFVDLGGIDGLVHKSELSWNKVNNPEAGYRVGEEVEAEVIDINHERGRISLSIRRLQPDPWHSTVADLKVGDIIEGTVTKIVNFGAFVRVREGLEGLIHISELSQQRVAHPGDVVHEGQKLNLKVISLDSERHRLGLSLKQAEETPARPPSEPGQPGQPRPERSERRGGRDRSGYDASQAVQEPEGGIDNTLAAAFAQVREQMAQQEAAVQVDTEPAAAEAAPSVAEAVPDEAPEAEAVAEETSGAEAVADETPEAEAVADETPEAAAVADEPVTEAVAEAPAEPAPAEAAPAEEAAAAEAHPAEAVVEEAEPVAAEEEPVAEAAAETEPVAATAAEPESPEQLDAEASSDARAEESSEVAEEAVAAE
jgi:small subunit ribosomal protein S1